MSGKPDHASPKDFQLLGLEYGAAPDRVKKAYKAFVKTWHPDRFPQGSQQQQLAEEKLKDVNAAYRRIRNNWDADIPEKKPEKARTEEPKAHEQPSGGARKTAARTSSPPLAFQLRSVYDQILTLFHAVTPMTRFRKNKGFCRWALVLLVLSCLAVVTKSDPFLSLDNRKQTSHSRKIDIPPFVQSVPLTPAAPEVTGPSEAPRQAQTPSFSKLREKDIAPPESVDVNSGRAFFTIGSSKREVLRVQGKPARVYGQTWVYGLSEVSFKEGRVSRYRNFDGALRVQVLPSPQGGNGENRTTFSLGSSKDEVSRVQGTPTQVEGNKWSYGFSEVFFKDGVVNGFNNFFNSLKVTMLPSKESEASFSRGYFTIGSSQDEVLAVQGTPTVVQGNTWSYQLSEIVFVDGKVRNVSNLSGNLEFLPPDSTARN
jgi:hypothetical protein